MDCSIHTHRRDRRLAENSDAFARQADWRERNGDPLGALLAFPERPHGAAIDVLMSGV